MSRFRPAALLPVAEGHDRGLAFAMAVMAFLACLAIMAGLGADRAARGWIEDLGSGLTVQIRPASGETGAEGAARAAEILSALKGVKEARAQDRKSAEALLEPWLGKDNIPEDLPLPQLVSVEFAKGVQVDPGAVQQALAKAGIDGSVDDRRHWMAEVKRTADLARLAAIAASVLLCLAAGAVIAFATRAGLAARRDVVEVLHLCGAEDRFVADLFMGRFAFLALRASAYGATAAALCLILGKLAGRGDGFAPGLPLQWSDLGVSFLAPMLAAAVAATAARTSAMAILKGQN